MRPHHLAAFRRVASPDLIEHDIVASSHDVAANPQNAVSALAKPAVARCVMLLLFLAVMGGPSSSTIKGSWAR
jgi:hypothetical protein